MLKKIIVTGGEGRFAQELKKLITPYNFVFRSKKQLNILSTKSIEKNLKIYKPDAVLHLAGLSRPMSLHEKKINESEVDWYNDLEKNKYISYAFDSKNFQTYDFVDIWVKYGDKDLKIDTLAGVLYFGENKTIKNINDCYKKQKTISDKLLSLFKNAKKEGPSKRIFYEADSTGKSSYTDIYLDLDEIYQVVIA